MSTFNPVASSLANFNDTMLTISTTPQATLLLFLASILPCKCDVHGPHSQINTEPFSSHVVCPAFGFISPAEYTTHLLSRTHATKKVSRFGGCGQFLSFIIKRILGIKHIFPCSFGNKRMHLLTRVYGICCTKQHLMHSNISMNIIILGFG